ncbi:MAG TPA: hypothetical protein VGQ83_20185 [Polyangia bacterium]|jgi:hypothetical protein
MPRPIALCLEDLRAAPRRPRLVRCVAVVGRAPGLRLDAGGAIAWRAAGAAACALCVSEDDRLVLLRLEGGGAVSVHRGGRSVAATPERPIVLLDQDELAIGARRLRLHVHGPTDETAAPEHLPERARGGLVRAAAAALLLGGAVGGTCAQTVEAAPPAAPPAATQPAPTSAPAPRDGGTPGADAPIEVRTAPPVPPPPRGGCGHRRGGA